MEGNCHNSLEAHGCPRKRVDISYNKYGAERWCQTNVVDFNETWYHSQPAGPTTPPTGLPRASQMCLVLVLEKLGDPRDQGLSWMDMTPCLVVLNYLLGQRGRTRPQPWAYGRPPCAPCPNEKFWKTLESENNTWNDSRNIWNNNEEKLWTIMETHEKTSKDNGKYKEYWWQLWKSNRMENIENTRITDRN